MRRGFYCKSDKYSQRHLEESRLNMSMASRRDLSMRGERRGDVREERREGQKGPGAKRVLTEMSGLFGNHKL